LGVAALAGMIALATSARPRLFGLALPDRGGGRPAADGDGGGGDFSRIVMPHLDAAYNLARYLTRDPDAAEDIVQEALLKAHRAFAGYRGGAAKAWLLAIVRRGFIDWSNARRAGRVVFSETETVEAAGEYVADPQAETAETALLRQGEIAAVRRALAALPEPFRESLILREIESLSYREMAEIAGVPIGTVMSRLARGRELLARALRSELQPSDADVEARR
jgi:RNA polymerase sigma-70 factor (ECF subfamily)